MTKYIIIIFICLGIGLTGGWLLKGGCNKTPSKPNLGDPKEPSYGTIEAATATPHTKVFMPNGGVIHITPTLNAAGDTLHIRAEDKFKWTEQDWPIKCAPVGIPHKKHIIGLEAMGFAGYNRSLRAIDVLYGASLNYTRMFGGTFGIGGGVLILHGMVSKDTYYGAKINILVQFGSQ
jgi:hypothetical protein